MAASLPSSIPRHIAVIMDGNGRWAKQRNRPRTLGHRAGVRAVRNCVEFCLGKGVQALTLFAFSSENWNRPAEEVGALMKLFLRMLNLEINELARQQVQLRFIGDRRGFPPAIQQRMQQAESIVIDQPRLTLTLAVGYGGRWDIVQAAQQLAREAVSGKITSEDIDENRFAALLGGAQLPTPDLLIRTGGDYRISNFLLWQLAYTELWFTEVLWPDLDANVLQQALNDYAGRERRFGLTSEQIQSGTKP